MAGPGLRCAGTWLANKTRAHAQHVKSRKKAVSFPDEKLRPKMAL